MAPPDHPQKVHYGGALGDRLGCLGWVLGGGMGRCPLEVKFTDG